MKRRSIIVVFFVLGIAGIGYVARDWWASSVAKSAPIGLNDDARPKKPSLTDILPAPQERRVGTAAVRVPTPDERQIALNLVAATKNSAPVDLTGLEPRAPVSGELLPRAPTLSEAQLRVLQKLQWGIVKELTYQGDGSDATVRLLSSPALAGPVDPTNPDSEAPADKARRFLAENRELFLIKNPNEEIVVTAVETDAIGTRTVRMAQRYAGLEVWPGQLTANVSSSGYLTVITGAYIPTPESVDHVARISPEEAAEAARRHLGIGVDQQQEPPRRPELKIFADKGRTPELAYEIAVRAPGLAERVFVSAITGGVLFSFSEICQAGTATTVPDIFGQPRTINVLPSGTPVRYYTFDTSKPTYSATTNTGVIAIYDASISPNPRSSSASLTSGFDPVAVSAAYNLGKVYDFYSATFNRNSYDGNGSSIYGFVRYPDPKTNGAYNNAFWDGQTRVMKFGNADAYAGASDVIGHEFTHAVVQSSANLVYNGESGALNESLADIMGEAFERYLVGTNDWSIGTLLRSPVRNMRNPQSKGQQATMSQYSRTTDDNGGVHLNSGIPNYAFYLLVEGLPSGGIGFDSARNIFYRALTTKLNSRSAFQDLRSACVLAAAELFGTGSIQAAKTGQAFDAVEIFDASVLAAPDNLTPPNGPDSYLITYTAVNGNKYLGRRETAMGDGSSVTAISSIAMDATSRASVSGDGALAVFVSSARDVVVANTNGTGATSAGYPGRFNSVAISADGNWFASIARDATTGLPLSQMLYINITTGQVDVIDLYQPLTDGPNSISIASVDEIDLSPDGQMAMFDGFAKTTLADGTIIQAWSIFGVDLRTRAVFSILGPLQGINIGNPAFARTSDQRIIFEASNLTSSGVYAADLLRGTLSTVRQFTPANLYLAYPRFSSADNFVVYTDQFFSLSAFATLPQVSQISLALDRMSPVGQSSVLQGNAYSGLSYRRGTFAGAPTLSVAAITPTLKGGQTGTFRVTRTSGDQAIRVPFSFKTLGTAKPSVDYLQMQLTAQIPAGATFVDIPVQASSSPSAPGRVLTLSLDPKSHYLIAASDASITISASAAPSIVSQPASQAAVAGDNVTLTIAVSDPSASFQWYKDGSAVTGATSSTLTLRNVGPTSAGSYTVMITNSAGSTTSNVATLAVTIPNPGRLINLSVLAPLTVAGDSFSLGYVVNGASATNAKPLVIRAAGPSLGALNYPGTLVDPKLELFAASTKTGENDDWGGASATSAAMAAVGAFAYTGPTSRDAAVVANITSRDNSVKISVGASMVNGTGAVIAEVYDATPTASFTVTTPRLINFSVIKNVGSSVTLGFVIGGTTSETVLVRAVGPTLATLFGFPAASVIADPKVELFDAASKSIGTNDNWGGTAALTTAFSAAGAFVLPANSKDAALVATLAPGNYSVVVTPVSGTATGTALLEVYDVP